MFESFTRGDIMRRIGVNRFWPTFPVGIYETKQGWLGVTTVTPAQWRAFCEMLGLTALRDDPTLFMGTDRLQRMEEIEGEFIPRLKQRTAQEWFEEGLRRKIPIVPVPGISDLVADQEKRGRGAIVPIMIGDETGFTAGSMQRLNGTPPRRGGAVPDIGEQMLGSAHTGEGARVPAVSNERNSLPLEGIRVVDFSMGWAGPICTRTLADLGADVIKIEATQYPDWWRGVDRRPAYVLEQMYEKSVRYCIMNRNKRGITLDLTRPRGLELAKRLLADADLVVDNYSVEVLPKLGLGYDVLSKLNPKLVMMSMSAFGAGSVNRDCRAYGSTLEQGSGLPGVVGDPDGPPVMSHTAFGDAVGGLNGCAAVLTALIHARLTGKGQFIDLAQIECMMPFAAPWIIAHSIDGKPPVKYGNRHPDFVPHGCFPCAGADNWIVVAISSDPMWPKLATLLGRADWAFDPKLATAAGRRAIESEIEAAVAAWTAGARSRSGDEYTAVGRRRFRRGAAADRAVERSATAGPWFHPAGRSRVHRPAPAALDAVPRDRKAVCDPQRATDAWRAQPRDSRRHARALRRRDRPAHARRHHRHRDADGRTADQRKEAGGGLMAETKPAQHHGKADVSSVPQPLMSVRGLGICFKTSQGVWQATRKIDFDIAAGERVGIVGESGCGKTITGLSILRLLPSNFAGLDGSIMFDGVDLARCSARAMRAIRGRRIAMIFQEPMSALDPVFTVGHQISETLRVHTRISKEEARERTLDMLRRVGIASPERRIDDYPHQLSGGMRQRVMIAASLICGPQLLIADEPTTALDVTVQAQILELLRDLSETSNTALMLITHDLGVVAETCTRMITMYAGEVIEDAAVDDALVRPLHPYTSGLLRSLPHLSPRHGKLPSIPGRVPSIMDMPNGCRFKARCPHAIDGCEKEQELRDAGSGRKVRCWRFNELDLPGALQHASNAPISAMVGHP